MEDNNNESRQKPVDSDVQKADDGRIRTSALKTAINERLRKGLGNKSK